MHNQITKLEQIYEGKAKIIYSTNNPDLIIQYFKDDTTAFNKKKFEIIGGKGAVNNQISELIMRELEKNGIKTHFVSRVNEREQVCKKINIIPLEVIVRNVAAGSFAKNYDIAKGTKLSNPTVEFCYKRDDLNDPLLNTSHIEALNIAPRSEVERIEEIALQINQILQNIFLKIQITLVDFKIEFGYDSSGNLLLADEISPDSCRLWDVATGENFDKDIFRNNTGNMMDGYTTIHNRLIKITA